jgi:hypothetical protein
MPNKWLVGLPEMALCESIHRIERALVNLDDDRHPGRATINLAPADLKKDAAGIDLPIALALLVATGQLKPAQLADFCYGWRADPGRQRPADPWRPVDGNESGGAGHCEAAGAGGQRPRGSGGQVGAGLRRVLPGRGGRHSLRPAAARGSACTSMVARSSS